MAAPTLFSQGAIAANTSGSLTVILPSHAANDILILSLIYWGPNTIGDAVNIPTPSGWTGIKAPGVENGTGDGWCAWFWKRATSGAEANPVCSRGSGWDTGTDTCFSGRTYSIRGCETSGNPWDDTALAGPHTGANGAVAAITVSGSERMVVQFENQTDDVSSGSISGWTNGTAVSSITGTDAEFQTHRKDNVSSSTSADASTHADPATTQFYAYCGISFKPPAVISGIRTLAILGAGI